MDLVIFCGSCNAFLFLVMRVICLWTPPVINTVKPSLVKDVIQCLRPRSTPCLDKMGTHSCHGPFNSFIALYNGIINCIVIILVLFIMPRS